MKNTLREEWDEIQIAYDRRNSLYVAYSTETGIVATGICVSSAVEEYKNQANALEYEAMHQVELI